jgi:hypothetical protein
VRSACVLTITLAAMLAPLLCCYSREKAKCAKCHRSMMRNLLQHVVRRQECPGLTPVRCLIARFDMCTVAAAAPPHNRPAPLCPLTELLLWHDALACPHRMHLHQHDAQGCRFCILQRGTLEEPGTARWFSWRGFELTPLADTFIHSCAADLYACMLHRMRRASCAVRGAG